MSVSVCVCAHVCVYHPLESYNYGKWGSTAINTAIHQSDPAHWKTHTISFWPKSSCNHWPHTRSALVWIKISKISLMSLSNHRFADRSVMGSSIHILTQLMLQCIMGVCQSSEGICLFDLFINLFMQFEVWRLQHFLLVPLHRKWQVSGGALIWSSVTQRGCS